MAQCPVLAVPRADQERADREAQIRQEVRARMAALYPGRPGLAAALADQVAAGLLEPGPLVALTGL
jgi:hypothetical protein